MATEQGRQPTPKRGKRPRGRHWIYEVEKALRVNHADIARLLTPEPLTVDAVRDIVNSLSNTAALQGLSFPVTTATVSDIIVGDSHAWERKAETLLWRRLGVVSEEYFQTGEIFGHDGQPFSRSSLRRYLVEAARIQKIPALAAISYFAETKPPVKPVRRKPRYIDPSKNNGTKKRPRKKEK